MAQQERIYLDNAATSWPKPSPVYDAVDRYQRHVGAPAGRSAYREATDVQRMVTRVRGQLAEIIGAESADHVVFTFNGTDSLNLAIHGTLRHGDHVVTTVVEHNSVLRPLRQLEGSQAVQTTYVACDRDGRVSAAEVCDAIRPDTRLVIMTHASNVTGAIQPVQEVGDFARQHGVLFLVDAAQTVGHVPIDVRTMCCDLLAAPGHKGLLGPLGTGILYLRPGTESRLATVRQGGTGTRSQDDRQPNSLPDKYESGNHNVPGIAGLGASAEFLRDKAVDQIARHEQHLTTAFLEGLTRLKPVVVHGPHDELQRVGVVSISIPGFDSREVAAMLDSTYGIQVRSGLHCAPRMHQSLGTAEHGGTVRFSLSIMNTSVQIEAALRAVADIAAAGSMNGHDDPRVASADA